MTESPRYALYLQTAMDVLRDAPGRLPPSEVFSAVEQVIKPNDYELKPNRWGQPRWITVLRFVTGDATTVGWMTKIGGWGLTEAGLEALNRHDTAEGLIAESDRTYKEIDKQRKIAQQNLSDVQQFIADAVAVVPEGAWTSQEDLAHLTDVSGKEIGHFLASGRVKIPGSYRVLAADGSIPPEGMLHFSYRGGTDLRERLREEGIEFDASGRASPGQRLDADSLKEIMETRRPPPSAPTTQRAWMVRGTSVEGHNLVDTWLREGWVSLAASQLSDIPAGLDHDELRKAVVTAYQHKSYAYQEQRLAEFDRFLLQMRPDDFVLTTSRGKVYIGRITSNSFFTRSQGGLSNLRREVEWFNTKDPFELRSLRPPIPALLQSQDYVVDLTAAIDELLRIAQPYTKTAEVPLAEETVLEFQHVDEALAEKHLIPDLDWLRDLENLLWRRRQIILYGPPGTGKTYLAQHLARHLTSDQAVKLVQFHPSYTYEDFVEGFRPRPGGGGTISFERAAGPFRNLAEVAQADRTTPYILIIDEINRAHLAKVFGELYFLLEYRNEQVSLQYSPNETFSLPENLFIIGTMNTSDRTIALPDAAMRRRFAFFELHPDREPTKGLLRRWLAEKGISSDAPLLADELNRRLAAHLQDGHDHAIGPSYLMHTEIYPDGLEWVWRTDIMPLMRELHFGTDTDIEATYGLDALRRAVQPSGDQP